MDDASLAAELTDLRQQHAEGELSSADYGRLRERLVLRAAVAEEKEASSSTSMPAWRWLAGVLVGVALVVAALVPAVRERGPGGSITGNDAIEEDAATAAEQWRAGDKAWEEGRLSVAIDRYRRAVAILPDRPELRTRLGLALGDSGRLSEAIKELRMAVRADPDLPITRVYLGGLLARSGRPDEAARQWRHYLKLAPDSEAAPAVRRSLRRLQRNERR